MELHEVAANDRKTVDGTSQNKWPTLLLAMAGQRFGLTNLMGKPCGQPWQATGLAQPEQTANGLAGQGWPWLAKGLA